MSVFMDLNLSPSGDQTRLRALVETAAHLGFSTVAINHVFQPTAKKRQGRSRPIRVLNRLTIIMSDAAHFRPAAAEYRGFDLLAVQPTTDKLFHAACMTYDVDIVCIPVTEKLPFLFKRAPVNGAVDRGVVFELSYSAAIRDSTLRRYTLANANALVEACRGKNVIVSSAAEKPLELRGPNDITNLALLFGLCEGDAKAAVSSSCRSAVLHAETRRTASGAISTLRSFSDSSSQQEAPPAAAGDDPVAKRVKLDPAPHLALPSPE
ncbi:ribonuclease P protein subunit p30 isoform X2 [Antennarius striatus]|uniref:ribonuclease P protein subunit p30 isoform X2 n=1 Tax=Antennarius striatus TaxID=241820 RepID=UPI0035B2F366